MAADEEQVAEENEVEMNEETGEEIFALPVGLLERLTRAALVIVKEQIDGRPWSTYTETQQQAIIFRIEDACADALERATDAIAARGFPVLHATLKQCTFTADAVTAPLVLSKTEQGVEDLAKAAGSRVLVVIGTDYRDFVGPRGRVRAEKDQAELELHGSDEPLPQAAEDESTTAEVETEEPEPASDAE